MAETARCHSRGGRSNTVAGLHAASRCGGGKYISAILFAFGFCSIPYASGLTNSSDNETLTGANFNSYTSETNGGAIYNTGDDIVVSNSTFFINSSGKGGGAINVGIGSGGTLDMCDPMGGNAGTDSAITIAQSGDGTWKLGGDNVFTSDGGSITFDVDSGTLCLYADGEVSNDVTSTSGTESVAAGTITLGGSNSSFILGSNATLVAAGENSISTDGTIVIEDGATIRGGTAYGQSVLPDLLWRYPLAAAVG